MEDSRPSSSPPRPRPWRTVVRDIASGRANETTAGEAYREVLRLLREQERGYGEDIWRALSPARTRTLRGERARLIADIAIVEALLKRIATSS